MGIETGRKGDVNLDTAQVAAATCRYCKSSQLQEVAWKDVLPRVQDIDAKLIYDGVKPISKTLRFCKACGAWLPTHAEKTQTEELIAALRLVSAVQEFSAGRLEHSDRPDLRLHLGAEVYGLEVTRIVRISDDPDGDPIGRSQWIRTVERIGRLKRRQEGSTPAWVSLMWNGHISAASAHAVAGLLNKVIDEHLPPTIGDMTF